MAELSDVSFTIGTADENSLIALRDVAIKNAEQRKSSISALLPMEFGNLVERWSQVSEGVMREFNTKSERFRRLSSWDSERDQLESDLKALQDELESTNRAKAQITLREVKEIALAFYAEELHAIAERIPLTPDRLKKHLQMALQRTLSQFDTTASFAVTKHSDEYVAIYDELMVELKREENKLTAENNDKLHADNQQKESFSESGHSKESSAPLDRLQFSRKSSIISDSDTSQSTVLSNSSWNSAVKTLYDSDGARSPSLDPITFIKQRRGSRSTKGRRNPLDYLKSKVTRVYESLRKRLEDSRTTKSSPVMKFAVDQEKLLNITFEGQLLGVDTCVQHLDSPVKHVCIFGPSRTGKSFLLNAITGENGVFMCSNKGAVIQGVDISNDIYSLGDKNNVRLIDIEGLEENSGDYEYMYRLIFPLIVSADLLIYNVKGQEGAQQAQEQIDKLTLIFRAVYEANKDFFSRSTQIDSETGVKPPLLHLFPHLIIASRDWTPTEEFTEEQYLQKLFKESLQSNGDAELQQCFQSIEVKFFPVPVSEAKVLIKHQECPMEKVEDEFQEQLDCLKERMLALLSQPLQTVYGRDTKNTRRYLKTVQEVYNQANKGTLNIQETIEAIVRYDANEARTIVLQEFSESWQAIRIPCLPQTLSKQLDIWERDATEKFNAKVPTSVQEAVRKEEQDILLDDLRKIEGNLIEQNNKAVTTLVQRSVREAVTGAEAGIFSWYEELPLLSETLKERLDELSKKGLDEFKESTEKLVALQGWSDMYKNLQNELDSLRPSLEETNHRCLMKSLREARGTAYTTFAKKSTAACDKCPMVPANFKNLLQKVRDETVANFEEHAVVLQRSDEYQQVHAKFASEVDEQILQMIEMNNKKFQNEKENKETEHEIKKLHDVVKIHRRESVEDEQNQISLIQSASHRGKRTGEREKYFLSVEFPMDPEQLADLWCDAREKILNEFNDETYQVTELPAHREEQARLDSQLESMGRVLINNNMESIRNAILAAQRNAMNRWESLVGSLALPMKVADLLQKATSLKKKVIIDFDGEIYELQNSIEHKELKEELETEINIRIAELENHNINQITEMIRLAKSNCINKSTTALVQLKVNKKKESFEKKLIHLEASMLDTFDKATRPFKEMTECKDARRKLEEEWSAIKEYFLEDDS